METATTKTEAPVYDRVLQIDASPETVIVDVRDSNSFNGWHLLR